MYAAAGIRLGRQLSSVSLGMKTNCWKVTVPAEAVETDVGDTCSVAAEANERV